MVFVRTSLFPYRLVLARKQPVQLSIDIRNDEGKDKPFVLEVEVPRALGLESSGPKCMDTKNLGVIPAGKQLRLYYDIHGKAASDDTTYPISVRVLELIPGSRDVIRTTRAEAELILKGR